MWEGLTRTGSWRGWLTLLGLVSLDVVGLGSACDASDPGHPGHPGGHPGPVAPAGAPASTRTADLGHCDLALPALPAQAARFVGALGTGVWHAFKVHAAAGVPLSAGPPPPTMRMPLCVSPL
jgi:hypothetical protein